MEVNKNTIIELRGIELVREGKMILKDVDLSVSNGDFIAITGPNGGGKTTLLRILLKLLKPTRGSVSYYSDGVGVKRLSIGYLPQKNSIDPRFPLSVRDVIKSGLLAQKEITGSERDKLVNDVISCVWLEDKADSAIGSLSGGQLQRCLLGRAVIASPTVLVLDEPLSYIDRLFESRMYDLIAQLSGKTTILLVSHEMTRFAEMANRHLIVNHGVTRCHSASHIVHCDCCG